MLSVESSQNFWSQHVRAQSQHVCAHNCWSQHARAHTLSRSLPISFYFAIYLLYFMYRLINQTLLQPQSRKCIHSLTICRVRKDEIIHTTQYNNRTAKFTDHCIILEEG